jgi:hypothetical protein
MRLSIERQPAKIYPDMKRVVARFFFNGEARAKAIISQVVAMTDATPARSAEFVKVIENVAIPYLGGEEITIWVGFDTRG